MEDNPQTNQVQTASMNRTKAPQKVEVVVANSSSGSEVNILGELSIFVLRIGFCALSSMRHYFFIILVNKVDLLELSD